MGIVIFLFLVFYIAYTLHSLSTIKWQVKLISKHLGIKEEKVLEYTNEEIEKILEEENNRL